MVTALNNEVERCQGYVGDAVCDGGPLDREHKKLFDETSLDDLKKLSLKEIEHLELKRMEFNAFKVSDEMATRINDAPGPGGYLKGFKATKADEMFFNDKKFLDLYLSKSDKEKKNIPRYAYYSKVTSFLNGHCQIGIKY